MFNIRLGIPEVENYWNSITDKVENNKANLGEIKLYKKLCKTFLLLSNNPKHPGLSTHEIKILSNRYNRKVFQSYVENRNPSAERIYWIYGPNKNDITIIGIEPHPNNKNNSYSKIKLSNYN